MYKLIEHPLTRYIIIGCLIIFAILALKEPEADDIDVILSNVPLQGEKQ